MYCSNGTYHYGFFYNAKLLISAIWLTLNNNTTFFTSLIGWIDEQKPFIDAINEILSIKEKDSTGDISSIENHIDEMVYSLYKLKPEEIEIVKNTIG